MFKKFKSIVALFMAVVLILGQNSYAFARAEVNALAPYQEKLIFLNNELGTDYVLSPTEDTTYDEMVTFYTNMSINEFEKYVRDAYTAEQEFDKASGLETDMRKDDFPVGYSSVEQQKYYYAADFNYLYINAYTTKVSGKTIYTGDIKSAGYYIDSYPAYKAERWTSSFSDDKKTVDMSYSFAMHSRKNIQRKPNAPSGQKLEYSTD